TKQPINPIVSSSSQPAGTRPGPQQFPCSSIYEAVRNEKTTMNTVRVTSWNALQEWLFADAWNDEIGRFRSQCAFRGVSDACYRLETSLIRLGGNFPALEHHLLRNFKRYAHRDVVVRDSIWHWLSVAQHHGLPTRLLDWTHSPLV